MKINKDKTIFILILFLIMSFIACYFRSFEWLHYKYSLEDSYYSHGYLIPFISGYLIFQIRNSLIDTDIIQNKSGLIIIFTALMIHIFGVLCDINFISGFSIFLYISGVILYIFGNNIAKKLIFPIVFLLFMFPIPDQYINYIGIPTKSIATDIGLLLINWLDIPYFREGFKINLANTILFVGTPCNGMKSFISFFALGILALHLTNLKLWKRVIVLISIYPLSVILNGLRIAILVYIANTYGIEKASPESYLHDMSGLFVFAVGILFLFLSIHLIREKK